MFARLGERLHLPLPAALVCRGTTRLFCCARPQRAGARLCLFRGRTGAQIGAASRDYSKRDRVDCLSRLILYEQGGIPWGITVLSQFSHNTMPMFPCGLMGWKMRAVRIVMRVVRGAAQKMVKRHVLPPGFYVTNIKPPARFRSLTFGTVFQMAVPELPNKSIGVSKETAGDMDALS